MTAMQSKEEQDLPLFDQKEPESTQVCLPIMAFGETTWQSVRIPWDRFLNDALGQNAHLVAEPGV